jgi:hypothetical protein
MIVVDVLDQIVHVAEIPYVASLPPTYGNLVIALAAVVVILAAAYEGQEGGRIGDVAGGIGRDRGRGGGRWEIFLKCG